MIAASKIEGKVFQEGVDARARGQTIADNPYCVRTDEHVEWAAGWRATFDLDEEDDPASDRDHPKTQDEC